jgi:NIPSNAP
MHSRIMHAIGVRPYRAVGPISSALCAPHEGSSTTAYGVYNIESLAAYERYRARLSGDPGRANYEFAKKDQFIRREDRIFVRLVSAPHAKVIRHDR